MTANGISILIASRKRDNPNWQLPTFLQSLEEQTSDPSCIEVLLKFDEDDLEILSEVPHFTRYSFPIKHLVSPRRRGILDLSYFYGETYQLSNPKFNFVMAAADDFVILEKGWEQLVFKSAKGAGDYFIIHQWLPFLDIPYEGYRKDRSHRIDESPIWSRKLVDSWNWFGRVGTSDGLTKTIQWDLENHYDICITYYLKRRDPRWPVIDRQKCADDYLENRWHTKYDGFHHARVHERHPPYPTFESYILDVTEKIAQNIRKKERLKVWLHRLNYKFQIWYARLVGNPIDIPGFSKYGSEFTTYLIEADYYGYNILCNNGLFYAFPYRNGHFELAKLQAHQYPHKTLISHSFDEVRELARKEPFEPLPYKEILNRLLRKRAKILLGKY